MSRRRPGRADTARTQAFYDDLAASYHLIYADWEASIRRQGHALDAALRGAGVPPEEPVLDCACGIGTQTLGLLSHGWTVIGTDLSRGAISRARTEAIRRGVRLPVAVADMRGLPFAEASVAALVCADNSLPHLTTPSDLATGLDEFRRVLRPGGVALISTRDYDRARQDPPSSTPPGVHDSRQGRVITFQLWHWHDDGERYDLEHFQLVEVPEGSWRVTRRTTTYWAITRDQLTSALTDAGFSTATWLEPAGSGFFQPLVVARRA